MSPRVTAPELDGDHMAERDPVLLIPGPLTTSRDTRAAMLRDWGSRDAAFSRMIAPPMERRGDG